MMKYIAFEGIDGAGKSTQLSRLSAWFERQSITPIRLFEPTNGRHGREVRRMIAAGEIDRRRELHEFLVLDRKAHIERKIAPLLRFVRQHPGFVLLQDRCYLSAPAYQGADDSDAMRLLKEEQSYAPRPDTIVLLSVPPALALQRLQRGGRGVLPFDTEEAIAQVQARYELVADSGTENVLMIDATGDEDEVHRRVVSALEVSDDEPKR